MTTQQTALALQKFSPADYGLYHQVLSCDEVMQKLTTQTLDDDKIKRAFDSVIANNALHDDFGFFKIGWQGQFVGYAKLKLENKDSTCAELAYFLLPKYWGLGLASMAIKQLIATAKTTHIRQLYATVSKQNPVSQHILAKFGFVYRHDEMIDDMDGEYWELDF